MVAAVLCVCVSLNDSRGKGEQGKK
jgi:hypothetical protein